ncbi:hypothetical protein J8273_6394 [Carpediemonas membranifera]|uniref:Uncharacterized protein n=1 Tax=Carpediemonas membranifera TaxID=201153 RepID=A0A8J6DY66_9EUKA|nr:hypothetical protein J8273_6394 [Carpediemonas membranifera]|eukprot:KAG9391629.1 hypothetical protein J8273_6394 [Carpediemonas membranifera]
MSQNWPNNKETPGVTFLEPCVDAKNSQHSLVTPLYHSTANPPFFDEKNIILTDSSQSHSQQSTNESQSGIAELRYIESSKAQGFSQFRFGTNTPDVLNAMCSIELESPRLASAIPFPSQRDSVVPTESSQLLPGWVEHELDTSEVAPITSPTSHVPVPECVQTGLSQDPLGLNSQSTQPEPPPDIPAIKLGLTPTRPIPMYSDARGPVCVSQIRVRPDATPAITPATRAVYQTMERSGRARHSLFLPEFSPIVPRCGSSSDGLGLGVTGMAGSLEMLFR